MTVRRAAAVVGVGVAVLAAFFLTARTIGLSPASARHASPHIVVPPLVAIDGHNRFFVDALPTPAEELVRRVKQATAGMPDKRVYLRADKNARYATVLDTIEDLRAAGISVSLASGPP